MSDLITRSVSARWLGSPPPQPPTSKAANAAVFRQTQVRRHHLEFSPLQEEVDRHEVVDRILVVFVQNCGWMRREGAGEGTQRRGCHVTCRAGDCQHTGNGAQ